MKTPLPLVALLGLALAACVGKEGSEKAAPTPPVFAGVPLPALARVVDTVGTPEAARAVLLVGMTVDSVAAYYRRELPRAGFRVVGDVADGPRVDLYAQRNGPPLWVQIQPSRDSGITQFAIIGAVGRAAEQGHPVPADSARRRARR